jgi:hypothetical protein
MNIHHEVERQRAVLLRLQDICSCLVMISCTIDDVHLASYHECILILLLMFNFKAKLCSALQQKFLAIKEQHINTCKTDCIVVIVMELMDLRYLRMI